MPRPPAMGRRATTDASRFNRKDSARYVGQPSSIRPDGALHRHPVRGRALRLPPLRPGLPLPQAPQATSTSPRATSPSCRRSPCSSRCSTRTIVAERIIKHSCLIDYPLDTLEIQVLDDSTDHSADIARKAVRGVGRQGLPDQVHPPRPTARATRPARWPRA